MVNNEIEKKIIIITRKNPRFNLIDLSFFQSHYSPFKFNMLITIHNNHATCRKNTCY